MKDTAKNNERMARFMGINLGGQNRFVDETDGTMDFPIWQPDNPKYIYQLFICVDAIREKTGWTFNTESEEYHEASFWFQDHNGHDHNISTGGGKTREEAIYAACLAAIEYIENE